MGKTLAVNRKARHDYTVEDTLEAGIALTGTEIKSIRAGLVNLQDAYARVEKGEAWLVGAHVAPWPGVIASTTSRGATASSCPSGPHRPARRASPPEGADPRAAEHLPRRPRPSRQGPDRARARQAGARPAARHRRAGRAGRARRSLTSRAVAGGTRSPDPTPGTEQAFTCYITRPGDAWSRQGLNPGEREPRCRQASLNRRQNEVTGNRQPALALAA